MSNHLEEVRQHEERLEGATLRLREKEGEITRLELGVGCDLKKELEARDKAFEESQEVLRQAQKDVDSSRRVRDARLVEYRALGNKIQSLNNEIHKVKGTQQNRQQQLEQVKAQVEEAEAEWKQASHLLQGVQAKVADTEKQIAECNEEKIGLYSKAKAEENAASQHKRALQNIHASSQSRFQRETLDLRAELDRNERRFSRKPIGPLASSIHLTDGWSQHFDLLEAIVGRDLLQAFIVFSKEDQQLLKDICRRNRLHEPVTYRKVSRPRYKVRDTSGLGPTFLKDCFVVDDDDVFNLLVDLVRIDRSIIGRDRDIQDLFKAPLPSTMSFVSNGYGLDYYRYTPAPGFSSFFIQKGYAGRVPLLEVDQSVARQKLHQEIEQADQRRAIITQQIQVKSQALSRLTADLSSLKGELSRVTAKEKKLLDSFCDKQKAKESFETSHQSVADLVKQRMEYYEKQKALEGELDKAKVAATSVLQKANQSRDLCEAAQTERDATAREMREKFENPRNVLKLDLSKLTKERSRCQNLKEKAEEKVRAQETRVKCAKKKCQFDRDKCIKNHAASQPQEEISDEACKALFEEFQALRSAENITSGAEEEAYREMKVVRKEIQASIDAIQSFKGEQARLRDTLDLRRAELSTVWNFINKSIRFKFAENMGIVRLEPYLRIGFKLESMDLKANGKTPDKWSGGERSKTLVCLIGALWDLQNAPFLCLDEWDVGLDDDARPDVEKLIVGIGTNVTPQLFLINPTKATANHFDKETEARIKRIKVIKNN